MIPHFIVCALAMVVLSGCANPRPWSLDPEAGEPVDMQPLTVIPDERDPSLYWDAVNQSSFYLLESTLDLPRQYRKLTGDLKQAYNADVFGQVRDCSWFTNRHGTHRMSSDEIRRGPNQIDGPDMSGSWMITRAKTEGVTPGFFIKDAAGETFVLKFDPVAYPELATGAEMVCTKLFYAIGYNVPENYLVTFDPANLQIKEGLQFKDRFGNKYPFTQDVLDGVLEKVAHGPDGRIRAIASRLLPGQPLGPFSYHGRRKDDPNDHIPHQHRRELRGLKVFAELVNHFDTKDHNSLDILVDEGGKRYIRHYLIDFGSTLGSDGDEPKSPIKGYAYVFDLEQAVVSLATLGLRRWSWEGAEADRIPPSVGYFESERFEPPGWKPLHANPAFDNMTHADAYWAARIIAAFTEEDVRACVEAAAYSDPAATDYLVQTLMERRRKILNYYYGKVNTLDDFALRVTDGVPSLSFVDRRVADGLGLDGEVSYRYRFGQRRKAWGGYRELNAGNAVTFDQATLARMSETAGSAVSQDDNVFHVQVQSRHKGRWGKWVRVYVYFDGDPASWTMVGIERDA